MVGSRSNTARPIRYQPLVAVTCAACAGIAADRFCPLPVWIWWSLALAAWAGWLALWRRDRGTPAGLILLGSVAATAGAWHHCGWHLFADDDLGSFARTADQPVCLEGIALQAARAVPEPRPDPLRSMRAGPSARLPLQVVALRDGRVWRSVSGRVEVYVQGPCDAPRSGDRLRVFALLESPPPLANPGQFDYARYLRADRRRCLLRASHVEGLTIVAPGSALSPRRWLDMVRRAGHEFFAQHLQADRARLAAAVLLGSREQLDPQQTEAYLETGTIHLLVVSGLNVGLLAAALLFALNRLPLPPWISLLLVAATAGFYMFLAGAEPPIVRATVLVLGTSLAAALGRVNQAFNTLAAAALVVLALNPCDLFNVGAQLSFLCVAGMAWISQPHRRAGSDDPLQRVIEQSRTPLGRWSHSTWRAAGQLTLVSTLIWLLVQPLVLARFHIVTPIAPLLNTVLWLPVGTATISGFLVLLVSGVPGLGAMLGLCCDLSLAAMEMVVNTARHVPYSHFWLPGPPDWWLAGFYGGLGLLAVFPALRPPRRWCLGLLAGWISAGMLTSGSSRHEGQLHAGFLSVKHGCAVVLELPNGQTLLYDAGQLGSPAAAGRSISEYLWQRGIAHLDAIVLSHADTDHYNGVPTLLERFSVGAVYVSPVMFDADTPALKELRRVLTASRVPVREISAGDHFSAEPGCRIDVLHPPRLGIPGSDNANSVVLRVQCGARRILLAGDLDSPGLEDVLAEEPQPVDVLLAPHHGSRRSHPARLVDWCRPRWIVVSGSDSAGLQESFAAYRQAGAQPLHTAQRGAVQVTIGAAAIAVRGFRPAPAGAQP